jgi:TM2 domain-containing membrane protein YozV
MKNPGTAAVLSFLITGMGQIYNGQIAKGICFVALQLVNIALMTVLIGYVTFFLLWVYAIYDAYK